MSLTFSYTLILILALAASIQSNASKPTGTPNPESLTLDQAVQLALNQHPEIRVLHARINAAQSRTIQVGALPNPEAVVRVESAPFRGRTGREAEYIAGVSQSLPVGGRLSAAKEAAMAATELVQKELEVRKFELRKQVQGAFAAALYAQDYATLLARFLEDSETALRLTKARVRSGDTLPADSTQMEVETLLAKQELRKATVLLQNAKLELANLVGTPAQELPLLAGALNEALSLRDIQASADELRVYIGAAEADAAAQRLRLRQARKERIPDVNLDLMYRRLEAEKEDGFDIGIRIPIPTPRGSKGRISEAAAEVAAAEARLDSIRNDVLTRQKEHELNLEAALNGARLLADEIVPRSETVLKTTQARYEAGDISLTELLPARRQWLDVQRDYLDALRNVMLTWSTVKAHK